MADGGQGGLPPSAICHLPSDLLGAPPALRAAHVRGREHERAYRTHHQRGQTGRECDGHGDVARVAGTARDDDRRERHVLARCTAARPIRCDVRARGIAVAHAPRGRRARAHRARRRAARAERRRRQRHVDRDDDQRRARHRPVAASQREAARSTAGADRLHDGALSFAGPLSERAVHRDRRRRDPKRDDRRDDVHSRGDAAGAGPHERGDRDRHAHAHRRRGFHVQPARHDHERRPPFRRNCQRRPHHSESPLVFRRRMGRRSRRPLYVSRARLRAQVDGATRPASEPDRGALGRLHRADGRRSRRSMDAALPHRSLRIALTRVRSGQCLGQSVLRGRRPRFERGHRQHQRQCRPARVVHQ